MAKKGGKKGKKGKDKGSKHPPPPPPVTTAHILEERTKMLCPRLGNYIYYLYYFYQLQL